MSYTPIKLYRLPLYLLGVIAIFGIVVTFANTANAEAGGAWMIDGSNFVSSLNVEGEGEIENEVGTLLTTIGGSQSKFRAKKL